MLSLGSRRREALSQELVSNPDCKGRGASGSEQGSVPFPESTLGLVRTGVNGGPPGTLSRRAPPCVWSHSSLGPDEPPRSG